MSTKYIITDHGEVVIGVNTYHQTMALEVRGKVIAAGHCTYDYNKDMWETYGESIGYGIKSQKEDAYIINERHINNKITML